MRDVVRVFVPTLPGSPDDIRVQPVVPFGLVFVRSKPPWKKPQRDPFRVQQIADIRARLNRAVVRVEHDVAVGLRVAGHGGARHLVIRTAPGTTGSRCPSQITRRSAPKRD